MARNVPSGDSIEFYHVMPSTRIATATTFVVEATYLGTNAAVPAANIFFGINEEDLSSVTNGRFNVRAGAHHFYVCVRVNTNELTPNVDRIQIKVTPQNNRDWFNSESFISSGILANRHTDSSLSIPITISTEEGKWGELDAVITPPLEKAATFNAKVTHVTTNSTALDGIQISVNNGSTWTNTLNNINFTLPIGNTGFKIRYLIKENLMEEGNRYFDITTLETTPIKVLKPLVNVKTRVTVIDTTKLNYGDLIGTYCSGRDLYGIYSNGNGGRYEEPIIINAAACGAVILPPDTVIQTFCAGTTRIQHLADGAGGYYRKVVAYDSPQCNYVARAENPIKTVTPTTLNPNRKGTSVILNPENDVFGALLRDNGMSQFLTRFGKWYFEVEVYIPTSIHLEVGLGFGTTNNNLAEWIGANQTSWSWWPYDSTKYHSDIQGIYAQTIDVKDKDIIGIQLDMENRRFGFSINNVWQGWCFEEITDEKMHFFIAGRFDSWAWVNFGKYAFKYAVPEGFNSGFGTVSNPPPEKGTVLGYFCVGVDQWKRLADGRGGYTTIVDKINAVECGWVDPKPPAGTVIGFVCTGFDKYNKIADGDGGFTLRLTQINSIDCGWTPPSEGSLSNIRINNSSTLIDPANVLTGDRMSFTNHTGSLVVDWGNYSGIWFWEFNDWTGEPYVGFQNRDGLDKTYNVWDTYGVAIEPLTGMVNVHGVKEQLLQPVAVGTPIGFKIDFKEQTITVYAGNQSIVILTKLNYPSPVKANRFYPSILPKVNGVGTGTFNFGQSEFHYPFEGSKPYQSPANPFPQRGNVSSYKCEHWTRYVSRADGNGGTYTELFQENSATCGWYPDPVVGTVLGYYCLGYQRWKTIANGNYTTLDVLVDSQSQECGYVPAGTIISYFCKEKDQWALVSDGNDGSYEELVKVNSPNCGFVDADNDFSDQEPLEKFNIEHDRTLPVTSYDIIHERPVLYEAGTVLDIRCEGFDLNKVVADGLGGSTLVLIEANSYQCGYVPPPPPVVLPILWENVALLVHGNSLIKENSSNNRTLTPTNVTSVPSAFVTGNGISFTGTMSHGLSAPGDSKLVIGTKDFCFEARAKLNSIDGSTQAFFSTRYTSAHTETYVTISVDNEGLIFIFGKQPGDYTNIKWMWPNGAPTINTEFTMAVQRNTDGELSMYYNGQRIINYKVAGPGSSPSYGPIVNVTYINKSDFGSAIQDVGLGRGALSAPFNGIIGEVRLTIGQHRFNRDSYTVDTIPFPEN